MVYYPEGRALQEGGFEVDSTESIWYKVCHGDVLGEVCFEVDSTESIWYKVGTAKSQRRKVLKLTPQSQYGIHKAGVPIHGECFEVDSTESIWYKRSSERKVRSRVLKLTPQSQYGISIWLS